MTMTDDPHGRLPGHRQSLDRILRPGRRSEHPTDRAPLCGLRREAPGRHRAPPKLPGVDRVTTVDDADAWWHAQTAERRIRIHSWLCRDHLTTSAPVDGQLEIPIPTERPDQ